MVSEQDVKNYFKIWENNKNLKDWYKFEISILEFIIESLNNLKDNLSEEDYENYRKFYLEFEKIGEDNIPYNELSGDIMYLFFFEYFSIDEINNNLEESRILLDERKKLLEKT